MERNSHVPCNPVTIEISPSRELFFAPSLLSQEQDVTGIVARICTMAKKFGKEAGFSKYWQSFQGCLLPFLSSLSKFFVTSPTLHAGQPHSKDPVHSDDKTLESELSRLMELSTKHGTIENSLKHT